MLINPGRRKLITGAAVLAAAESMGLTERQAYAFHAGLAGAGSQPNGGWRDLTTQPHSRRAFINSPIGTGAVWDTTSTAAQQLRAIGTTANTVATVHSGTNYCEQWTSGTVGDVLVQCTDTTSGKYNQGTVGVYMKAGAIGAGGTNTLCSVDFVNQQVFHGYQVQISDTTGSTASLNFTNTVQPGCIIHYNQGSLRALRGDGIAPFGNNLYRTRYQWGAGEGRWDEVQRGRIDHVLRCVMSYNLVAMVNTAQWDAQQFPTFFTDFCATAADSGCSGSVQNYSGSVPFGVLLGIPSSININSLTIGGSPLNANQKMVFVAAQNYGILCTDSTGYASGTNAQFSLNFEPDMGDSSKPHYNQTFLTDVGNAMLLLMSVLGICMNYDEHQFPYAGCGTPMATCPPAGTWDTF